MSVTAVPLRPIKKGSVAKFWAALVLLTLLAVALAWWTTAGFQATTLPSGVRIKPLRQGKGALITANDVVALNYRLHVGTKQAPVIQDSRETGQPFVTTTQGLFPGFADGLQHMRPGGSYVLTLPGGTHVPTQMPGAPFKPSDTLVFEIDVLQVEAGAAQRFLQAQQMQRMQQLQQLQQLQQGRGQGGSPGAGNQAEASEAR
ncbi:MAG: FKBP-type peptidyl-prolyl cis-trans isomerase [Alphaproteobacteria bacterium]|nr:FKBP-type peptidyl-prolyl cis-trans isomerase [Alphaproteobacteria bacterium]